MHPPAPLKPCPSAPSIHEHSLHVAIVPSMRDIEHLAHAVDDTPRPTPCAALCPVPCPCMPAPPRGTRPGVIWAVPATHFTGELSANRAMDMRLWCGNALTRLSLPWSRIPLQSV